MTGPQDESAEGAPESDAVGSAAEEAVRLMAALSGWARDQTRDSSDDPDDGAGDGAGDGNGAGAGGLGGLAGLAGLAASAARRFDEHVATGAPECTWCPVCRAVHVVRTTPPEVRAHLTAAAGSLLQAAAGLLATAVPTDRSAPDEPGETEGPGEES